MSDSNHLGAVLKQFRKSKGITQQELELLIEAAPGHVSRIESGTTNPTKETLIKIIKQLSLTEKEANSLLFFEMEELTESEIQRAVEDTQAYLSSSPYPAYLADDRFRVHNWNLPMLKLLGADERYAQKFRGICSLAVLFSPDLPFRQSIPKDRFKTIGMHEIQYFLDEIHYDLKKEMKWVCELILVLTKFPDFNDIWEQAQYNYRRGLEPGENIIYFNVSGKTEKFFMSVIKQTAHPRFRIVEYLPQNNG